MAMTIEQQRAVALARARQRAAQGPKSATREPTPQPPVDDAPWYVDAAQAADDMARIAANALTLGQADKIAGYLGGGGTEAEAAKTQDARDRAGWAGTAMDVTAGAGLGLGLASKGITAMRAVPSALGGAKGVAVRTAAMGADGAALSGAEAALNGHDVLPAMAIGAAAGAGGNLLGEGASAFLRGGKSGAVIPATEDIGDASRQAYQMAKNADLIVAKPAVQRLKQRLDQVLADEAFSPELEPAINAVRREIENQAANHVTGRGLDTIRKVAVKAAMNGNPSERRLAGMLVDEIDEFATGLKLDDVLQGDAAQAAEAFGQGRDLWRRYKKSQTVDEALYKGSNQTGSAYSGGNIDNATRQQFKTILNNPKTRRQFNKTEQALMQQVVKGKPIDVIYRSLAKLSPTGSGLMAMLQGGGAIVSGNPALMGLSVIGMGAKGVADRVTASRVQKLVEAVRLGQLPPQAINNLPGPAREAAVRMLTAAGISLGEPLTALPAQQ